MLLCYPSTSTDEHDAKRMADKYGSIIKREELDKKEHMRYRYDVSINKHINEERMARLERSSLVHWDTLRTRNKGDIPEPARIKPKHLDDELFRKLEDELYGLYLAKVTLKDGTVINNVVFVHNEVVKRGPASDPPHMSYDNCNFYIDADDILDVAPCPNGIPARLRQRELSSEPTFALTGHIYFGVVMNDGSIHACGYSSYDYFIDLPSPYTVHDIKELRFNDELPIYAPIHLSDPVYATCIIKNRSLRSANRSTRRPVTYPFGFKYPPPTKRVDGK